MGDHLRLILLKSGEEVRRILRGDKLDEEREWKVRALVLCMQL